MQKTDMLALVRGALVRLLCLTIAYLALGDGKAYAAIITVMKEKTVDVTGYNGNTERISGEGSSDQQYLRISLSDCTFSGLITAWSNNANKRVINAKIKLARKNWSYRLESGNNASGSYDIHMTGKLACTRNVTSLEYTVTDWYGLRGWGTYKGKLDVSYSGGGVATADVEDQIELRQPKGSLSLIRRADPSVSLTVSGGGGRISLRRKSDGVTRYVNVDPKTLLISWDTSGWEAGAYAGTVTLVGKMR